MTVSRLPAFGLIAGLGLAPAAPTANAVEFRSTYSETRNCPVTEEGDDAFIRECTGPGHVRAVLQYVDGLFGVFYLPMGGKAPMGLDDMLEVSANARQPYGAKHEWRQRVGDGAPCAAIIRAYTTRGELLVVTELATGSRLGRVKTNQQARDLADRACKNIDRQPAVAATTTSIETGSALAARPASPPPSTTTTTAAAMVPVATDDIDGLIANGQERFRKVYIETGISGAIEAIEECYSVFNREPSFARLVQCGALDIVAADTDRSVLAGRSDLQQAFLAKEATAERIAAGTARLGLDQAARDNLSKVLGIDATPTRQSQKEIGSVFDFSE